MRTHDQRVFGHYDTTPRTRMLVNEYSSMDAAEQNQRDLDDLPAARLLESVQLATDDERADLETPPCGRDAHDEADDLVKDLDDEDS
jgi:hypothetical protein